MVIWMINYVVLLGRTDAEAETLATSCEELLTGKGPDAGKD